MSTATGNPNFSSNSLIGASFMRLSERWLQQVEAASGKSFLPAEADQYSHACLLLADKDEFSWHLPLDTNDRAIHCITYAAERLNLSWMDVLPWKLIAAITSEENELLTDAVAELEVNLNHHNSGIRKLMMTIGWLVSSRLDKAKAVPLLLENVANTLAHYEAAFGLVWRLIPDRAELGAAVAQFHAPPRFADQFIRRTEELIKYGADDCQQMFVRAEARYWRLICESNARTDLLRWARQLGS